MAGIFEEPGRGGSTESCPVLPDGEGFDIPQLSMVVPVGVLEYVGKRERGQKELDPVGRRLPMPVKCH